MIRTLFIIAGLTLLSILSMWLYQFGEIEITWQGYHIEMSLMLFIMGMVAAFILLYGAIRMWAFIINFPERFVRQAEVRKMRESLNVILKAQMALALEDPKKAQTYAKRLKKLLPGHPLSRLFLGSTAVIENDFEKAAHIFKKMEKDPEGGDLGLLYSLRLPEAQRYLAGQSVINLDSRREHDRLARLIAHHPHSPFPLSKMFEHQVRERRYDDAANTLQKMLRHTVVPPALANQRQAMVAYLRAQMLSGPEARAQRQTLLEKSHKHSAAFLPAALELVEILQDQGTVQKAKKICEQTWRFAPHPDLARSYRAMAKGDDPMQALEQAQHLATFNPNHPESALATAEAALKAKMWGIARETLATFHETHIPTLSSCKLMSELELGEYNDTAKSHDWLEKMETATANPGWHCRVCTTRHKTWVATCETCQTLESVSWG